MDTGTGPALIAAVASIVVGGLTVAGSIVVALLGRRHPDDGDLVRELRADIARLTAERDEARATVDRLLRER